MKRQSTTSKIAKWALSALASFLPSGNNADGFIARYRGVEYAIVGIVDGMLIPCPVLHPGVRMFYRDEMTIRKGLV
jgi:hypothetical protein